MNTPRIGENWQERLRSLQPNWDKCGAPSIDSRAIAAVEELYVAPGLTGGVQVQTHQDGWIEIKFNANGTIQGALMCKAAGA